MYNGGGHHSLISLDVANKAYIKKEFIMFLYKVVGKLPSTGNEGSIEWTRLEENAVVLNKISWKIIKHIPSPDRVNPKYRK